MSTRAVPLLVLLLALPAASCGPAESPATESAERAEHGRAERAFWTCYDRARAAVAAHDEDAARSGFEEALTHKPDHAASIYALAGIEHRAGRPERALAWCDRLLEIERPRTRALLLRAAVRSDVESVLAAGEAWPPRFPAWIDLAQAEADAAAAETENPEETGPHVARARIALLRGGPEAAAQSLTRALTIHPGHAEALALRALAAERGAAGPPAAAWIAKGLAATRPKANPFPPGEGDTQATLAALQSLDTGRLRALADALRAGTESWPDDAPRRPPVLGLTIPECPATEHPLRVTADFDGDGAPDELTARRAPERAALLSLFGMHDPAHASFTLRLGGRDATAGSGLADIAVCAAALVATDADGDGRTDVVVLPGPGDPARREPPLLLLNAGGGAFEVRAIVTR